MNSGNLYARGLGDEKDEKTGFELNLKAARQGEAIARFNVGRSRERGEGTPRDYTETRKWYEKAAQQGRATTLLNPGILYDEGKGGWRDVEKSARFVRMAADKNNKHAQYTLARYCLKGEGVPKATKRRCTGLNGLPKTTARWRWMRWPRHTARAKGASG